MSAENNGGPPFDVYIKDMGGRSITIEKCTPETLVSSLIEQFREGASRNNGSRIPESIKRHKIILINGTDVLNETTLGDNNIRGYTNLSVVYNSNTSCIHSEPIAEHLHRWIEGGDITFNPSLEDGPRHDSLVRYADSGHLLAEYNNWSKNGYYRFFLTNTQTINNQTYSFVSNRMGNRLINYYSNMKRYHISRQPIRIKIYVDRGSGPKFANDQNIIINNSSVEGIFERIDISIIIKHDYSREFNISVVLKAPFIIYKPDGTISFSSDNPKVSCHIPYDSIVMCNENRQPNIPDKGNLAGGRRTKRSKRSKRSQKKRKTRRTRKNRA